MSQGSAKTLGADMSLIAAGNDVDGGTIQSESTPLLLSSPPQAVERLHETSSTLATFFIFLKSYLGSGIMGMASAYLSGGFIPVTLLIYGVAVLSCTCFYMVFSIRDVVAARPGAPPVHELSFERIVEEVLGPWGKRSVIAALVFTQAGFATAYVIFIASNLESLYPQLSFYVYAVLLVPPLVLLCWIRQVKWISPFALAGMVAIWVAVGTVCYYSFSNELIPHGVDVSLLTAVPWASVPVAFGVVVYLFEGVGLIIPLESQMRHRQHFPMVMWGVHLSVATAVALFGLMGYLAFGTSTCGPIIKNLPTSGWLVITTVWGLNLTLLVTYPIQMLPVFQIAEDALFHSKPFRCCGRRGATCTMGGKRGASVATMGMRALVVVLSVGVGVGIPYFNLFLSLIGGLGSAQLMFIIPPVTYYYCFRDTMSRAKIFGCCLLLLFGIGTLVVTTTFTIIELVHQFQNPTLGPCNGGTNRTEI